MEPIELSFAESIRQALFDSMAEDPSVICFGLGVTDPGGVFGTTIGLVNQFGATRVFDGPTSENAMTGVGVGASISGLKPVISHQRLDFFLLAMDQLVNSAAKWHFMFGKQLSVPITIRLILGRGWGQGPTHSQNLQAWFAHIPGLRVVAPALPNDAYHLLRASISDPNPVVFLEHRWLHGTRGRLAGSHSEASINLAIVRKKGTHITLCASSLLTVEALRASKWLDSVGVSCEVIDLRTLNPIDWTTIFRSVEKTGRLIVADPGALTGSIAGEIVARVSENLFGKLKAPPVRLAQPDIPEPTSYGLTTDFHVNALKIAKSAIGLMGIGGNLDFGSLSSVGPHDVPGDSFKGPF